MIKRIKEYWYTMGLACIPIALGLASKYGNPYYLFLLFIMPITGCLIAIFDYLVRGIE